MGQIIGFISGLFILSAIYLKIGDGNKKLANTIFAIGFGGAIIFIFIFIMAIFEV